MRGRKRTNIRRSFVERKKRRSSIKRKKKKK
jgi:hypothetical protein